MHAPSRTLCRVACLGLILVFAASPMHARAQGDTSRQAAHASGSCCLPSQVSKWEALLPVHPSNPQAIVRFVTHLKLVNFQVLSSRGNVSVHRPNGYNTIQYFFGYMPPATGVRGRE
jgi:hypothetical protein